MSLKPSWTAPKHNKNMSNHQLSLFDSIIKMTSARDRRSLEISLVTTLEELLKPITSICLLRVSRSDGNNDLEVAACIPSIDQQKFFNSMPNKHGDPRVKSYPLAEQCISQGKISSQQQAHLTRTLFPIIINKRVSAILDVHCTSFSSEQRNMVDGFVQIYSNFLAIAHDNEHDTLTGLLNRKTFDLHLSELLSSDQINPENPPVSHERRTNKQGESHWISLLDIDFFKSVNDNFGHVYGDEVLLLFSKIMLKTFRNNDIMFRYGGEEFVVVLAPSKRSDALLAFERFRQAVEQFDFPKVGKVTVSIGVASLHSQDNPTTVLEYADEALYYAKGNGRNQVLNYCELLDKGLLKAKVIDSDIELF